MSQSWLLTLPCNRAQAEGLTGDHPALAGLEPMPVLVASEEDEDADIWRIDAYFEGKPPRVAIAALARALDLRSDKLPKPVALDEADWVTMSQVGLEPVRAGRFHVHTGADEPDDTPGIVNFRIDAGQAFGTGHHATTAGCLAALDRLYRQGRRYRDVADIGTGTGLLAFAALELWPRAFAIASDIDAVSVRVTIENALANGVPVGSGRGALMVVEADGTRHPLIAAGAPYDLVIANILAGPLIALAPALAAITAPGGTLVLAGLLAGQRRAVTGAYRRAGFRLDTTGNGEWSVLTLTRRRSHGWQRPRRASGSAGQVPGDFGSW